jgi:hypothetical protein
MVSNNVRINFKKLHVSVLDIGMSFTLGALIFRGKYFGGEGLKIIEIIF